MMLPNVLLNLDFAASDSGAPPAPAAVAVGQNFLLLGTGCWVAPLLAAVLAGVR